MKFHLPLTLFSLLFLLLSVAGCGHAPLTSGSGGDTLTFRHATLLHIERTDSYTIAEVRDAWRADKVLHRYVLVPRRGKVPAHLPYGTVLRTPLRRVIVGTSVHAALLAELGRQGNICGLCDTAYLQHEELRKALKDGYIADMGSSVQPVVERVISADADALFLSSFENAGHGTIAQAGIPIVECIDYMERSPLGRAEWMRFFGLLMGCEAEADSMFAGVERRYEQLRHHIQSAKTRPTLMCDRKEGALWYVPGAESTMGQLYTDAGATYLFAHLKGSGSLPLSFETVYNQAREADVWLLKYGAATDITYQSLQADFPPYKGFRPWREKHIYGCNTFRTPFYEEVPFRPDLLLSDIAAILHPELLSGHTLRYFQSLK